MHTSGEIYAAIGGLLETLDLVHRTIPIANADKWREDCYPFGRAPGGDRRLGHLGRSCTVATGYRTFLTDSLHDNALLDALLLGVGGIVVQNERPSKQLVACIRKVYAGDQWLECSTVGGAVETLLRREVAARAQP